MPTTEMKDVQDFSVSDLLSPAMLAYPYDFLRRLRHEDPVHEDPEGGGWMISCYEEAAAVLGDKRFSADRAQPRARRDGTPSAIGAALARQMLFLDPPDHTRLRSLFTKAFTPQNVEALLPQVRIMVSDLLDSAEDLGGEIDFVSHFAVPLPVTVIAQMLGVPEGDRTRLREMSVGFGKIFSGRILPRDEALETQQATIGLIRYFGKLIADRRNKLGDDMLSELIRAEENGDRLTTEELTVNLVLLLAAGHLTTTHFLGNSMLALSRNRDQWKLLVDEPSFAPVAINELLRLEGSAQATSRKATEDTVLRGRQIRAGDRVVVLLSSANRDEKRFADSETLLLQRPPTRVLSFGYGIHACLGSALARMESQAALSEIARRFPHFEVTSDDLPVMASLNFRGRLTLPMALHG